MQMPSITKRIRVIGSVITKRVQALGFAAFGSIAVAHADLSFIDDTTNTVMETMLLISAAIITIAILVAGYLMLFTDVSGRIIFRILAGGAIIGAAPAIGAFFAA